jgi:hypothetical protein
LLDGPSPVVCKTYTHTGSLSIADGHRKARARSLSSKTACLRAACTTRSRTVAIPSRRCLPPRLGISRSVTGAGRKLGAQLLAERAQEPLDA